MTKKQNNILNFLGLLFLLVVLPLGAIYLLDEGINYRKDLIADLEDHGKIPGFSLIDYSTKTIVDNERLKGGLVVINFMSLEEKQVSDIKGVMIAKIHQQFDDRKDVFFLNFVLGGNQDTTAVLTDFIKKHQLEDTEQCFFVRGERDMLERMASAGFKIPLDNATTVDKSHYVAFCDTKSTIRKYYNMEKEDEVKLLVKHLMLLLPVVNQRKGKYETKE